MNFKNYFIILFSITYSFGYTKTIGSIERSIDLDRTLIKDTLKYVFNEDSLKYYYAKDIASIDKNFEVLYANISDNKLKDLIDSLRAFPNYTESSILQCKLLILGIKRNIPDIFAYLGDFLLSEVNCYCGCNQYKGFLYLYHSTRLKSSIGFQFLAYLYMDYKLNEKAIEMLISASNLGNPNAAFTLFQVFQDGDLGTNDMSYWRFIDKKKALFFLDRAVELNEPYAMVEKARRTKQKSAFDLLIRAYKIVKNNVRYGDLMSGIISGLEDKNKKEWKKYKELNKIENRF